MKFHGICAIALVLLVQGSLGMLETPKPRRLIDSRAPTPEILPPPWWKPEKCGRLEVKCESDADCSKCGLGYTCKACPSCECEDPKFCVSRKKPCNPPPPCAPPNPDAPRCPPKAGKGEDCTKTSDCIDGLKCKGCPSCPGERFNGKCLPPKEPRLCLFKPACECKAGQECDENNPCCANEFCFRCPRCEGPGGSQFNGPGVCLDVTDLIRGCAAPPPCDLFEVLPSIP